MARTMGLLALPQPEGLPARSAAQPPLADADGRRAPLRARARARVRCSASRQLASTSHFWWWYSHKVEADVTGALPVAPEDLDLPLPEGGVGEPLIPHLARLTAYNAGVYAHTVPAVPGVHEELTLYVQVRQRSIGVALRQSMLPRVGGCLLRCKCLFRCPPSSDAPPR